MKPVTTFQDQPRHFWAHVKLLSEGRGYSVQGKLKRYTPHDLKQFLSTYGLSTNHLDAQLGAGTTYGELITTYIDYRANILETFVATHLMNREQQNSNSSVLFLPSLERCHCPTTSKVEKRNIQLI